MFYHLAMAVIRIYLRILFKIEVIGKENLPKKGGIILCSNHSSNFDPFLVCTRTRRKVYYLAKKELFSTKFKNYWMRNLAAFPIDREKTDLNALKLGINLLKGGSVLGIFVHGTRAKDGVKAEAKNGVSLFALKGNSSVVPIGITSDYKKRAKVIVNIGKPISFEKYKNEKAKSDVLSKMTEEIVCEIEKLIIKDS